MLRPTQSPVLYNQMIGRGTRLVAFPDPTDPNKEWIINWEKKKECHIYDFVDLKADEMGVQTLAKTIGIESTYESQGEDLFALKEKLEEAGAAQPYLQMALFQARSQEEINAILSQHNLIDEIKRLRPTKIPNTKLDWIDMGQTHYLALCEGELARLTQSSLGQYILHLPSVYVGKRELKNTTADVISSLSEDEKKKIKNNILPSRTLTLTGDTIKKAITEAEKLISETVPGDLPLIRKNAAWKIAAASQPISEGQKNVLKRLMSTEEASKLSKAEASDLITKVKTHEKILQHQKRIVGGKYQNAPAFLVAINDNEYLQWLKNSNNFLYQKNADVIDEALTVNPMAWFKEYRPELYASFFTPHEEVMLHCWSQHPDQVYSMLKFIIGSDPKNEWRYILNKILNKQKTN
jgi:hypothetical protein